MTLKEKILEELRKNIPLTEIRKRYSSNKSARYNALAIRIPEQEEQIEKNQYIINKQNEQISKQQEKIKKNQSEIKKGIATKKKLSSDIEKLESQRQTKIKQINEKQKKLDTLDKGIELIEAKGINLELIELLEQAKDRDAEELRTLLQLKNSDIELQKKVELKLEQEEQLTKNISKLEKIEQNNLKKLASQRNELDFIEAEKLVWGKTSEVIKFAFKRGYSKEEIASIFLALEKMEIKDQPISSIKRLIDLFSEAKSFVNLKTQKQFLEKTVEELSKNEKEIRALIEYEIDSLTPLSEKITEEVKKIIKSAGETVNETLLVPINNELKKIQTERDAFANQKSKIIAYYKSELGKLESQKTIVKPLIYLMGFDSDPEAYKKVSDKQVVGILENIQFWFENKYPNSIVQATINLNNNKIEETQFACQKLRVGSALTFVSDYLKKRNIEDKQKN